MRRALLIAALVSLLGLTTAVAANVSVEVEDVASFTTDVSISVPDTPVVLGPTIYIGGAGEDLVGPLLLEEPANINTTNRFVKRDVEDVQAQTDPTAFFAWKTMDPTPPGGYLLDGTVTLTIAQNRLGTDRMTAGLFECESSAPPASSTPPSAPPDLSAAECQLIATQVAEIEPGGGTGFKDRTVMFGAIGPVLIDAGHDLRLKIVNKSDVSTQNWDLSWGYNPARTSILTIEP